MNMVLVRQAKNRMFDIFLDMNRIVVQLSAT